MITKSQSENTAAQAIIRQAASHQLSRNLTPKPVQQMLKRLDDRVSADIIEVLSGAGGDDDASDEDEDANSEGMAVLGKYSVRCALHR